MPAASTSTEDPLAGDRPARPRRRPGRVLAILLLSSFGLLVLAEVAAHIYVTRIASLETFGRFASLRQVLERQVGLVPFIRHRHLGYYPAPNFVSEHNSHNSLGFRGPEFAREKPAGTFRIACIGGSTTYGMGVRDHRETYPAVLEKLLHERGHTQVEIINAGCNGWCTVESLINLKLRVLDLEPDLLLVYHSANDIHARFVWPPEHYLGDNSGFRTAASNLIMPGILEYSALYRIVAVSTERMTPHAGMERNISLAPEWSRATEFRVQTYNGNYPRGTFKEVSAEEMLRINAPIYYRRNLTEIVRTGRTRGMQSVLVNFVYNDFEPRSLSASPPYKLAYAQHEEVQREVAGAEGAHYFDLRAAFPVEKQYFTDDMHMTTAGYSLMARMFADYLEAEDLLP